MSIVVLLFLPGDGIKVGPDPRAIRAGRVDVLRGIPVARKTECALWRQLYDAAFAGPQARP
jgi:hypothetical protein